ncbi:unnamed protein product, partial [Polarella glacialis]
LQMPRGRLVWLSRFFPYIDAKFVDAEDRGVLPMDADLKEFLINEGLFADKKSLHAQAWYKYQIGIDGNSASDRIYSQLFMGSVVLIPEGPWKLTSLHSMLKPWVHFVPVRHDLSDLVERLDWLRENDDQARQIARNAVAFAH